jgi:HEAT repeat protein
MTQNISKNTEITTTFIYLILDDPIQLDNTNDLTKYLVAKCLSNYKTEEPDLTEYLTELRQKPGYRYLFSKRCVSEYTEKILRETRKERKKQEGSFIELDATKKEEDKSNKPQKPEKFLSIAKDNQILVLLGEAGSGKTTTLRHYFKECLTNLEDDTPGQKTPVFIKLKRFKEHTIQPLEKTLSNLILTTINNKLDSFSQISIDEINLSKDFIFLFDGLDEITDSESYKATIEQLQILFTNISNEGNSKVIISCRSRDYHNSFNQYSSYELKALENYQIKNYLSDFLNKDIGEIFDEQIKNNQGILEMARIPFLLYIMACIIEKNLNNNTVNSNTQLLPHNKGALIKQFVEDICSDQSKETVKTVDVPPTLKYKLLSMFAFDMLDCGNRGDYTCPANIRNNIEDKYYKEKGITATQTAEILLKAEKERLLKSGSAYGELEFIHALVRDYFVAYYLSQINKDELLERTEECLENTKWDEAIILLVGIVDEETSDAILKLLAVLDPYFGAQCFPKSKYVDSKTEDILINILLDKVKTHNLFSVLYKTLDAFVNLKSEKALFPLIEFFGKCNEQTYVYLIVRTICELYSERAVEPLLKLLNISQNELTLMFAACGLGELRSEDAIEPLILLLEKSKSEQTKIEASSALCQLIPKDKENIIIELLEKKQYGENLKYVSYILGKIGSKRSVSPLINLLGNSNNNIVLRYTAEALSEINTKDVFASLIHLIENNTDENTLIYSSYALGMIGSSNAIDPLIKLMEDSHNENVLQYVIDALGKLRAESAVQAIIDLMGKINCDIFLNSATDALIKIDSKESVKPLIELLDKTDCEDTINYAIYILGQLKSHESVAFLVEVMMNNNDSTILRSVSEALCNIGSEEAVKPLIDLMKNTNDKEALEHIIETLGDLGYKDAVSPLANLMESTNEDEDYNILISILGALGNLGSIEAVKPLIKLLENTENIFIAGSIADALGSIGSTDALNPLKKFLQDNKFENYHFHALYSFAIALINFGYKEVDKIFIRLVDECADRYVLTNSIHVLYSINSTESVEHIVNLMKRSKDEIVIKESAIALCILDSKEFIGSVISLMQSSEDKTHLEQTSKVVLHFLPFLPEQENKEIIAILLNKYKNTENSENKEIIYETIDTMRQDTGRRYLKELQGFP